MRILIACNAARNADHMLRALCHAGLPWHADALIVAVTGQRRPLDFRHASSHTARVVTALANLFPRWTVDELTAIGAPAHELLNAAHSWNADLIALGGLDAPGDITRQIIRDAPCSVRICRTAANRPARRNRILIGYDGLPGSQAAVRAVAQRAWPRDTEITLLTSVGFGHSPVAGLMLPEDNNQIWHIQRPAENLLRDAGIAICTTAVDGDPKQALLDRATADHTDSIVIGDNGRGPLYRLFIGDVASALIPHTACSFEIARSVPVPESRMEAIAVESMEPGARHARPSLAIASE